MDFGKVVVAFPVVAFPVVAFPVVVVPVVVVPVVVMALMVIMGVATKHLQNGQVEVLVVL